jgi:hypothetical protein
MLIVIYMYIYISLCWICARVPILAFNLYTGIFTLDLKEENNLYSVVAKTTTFLSTNSKLTYQHETKKNTKMKV